ncbi:uncharacterized protein KRP23_276 [Phytophthora ramorum]|uniref:uncharacterized protein n=1 Tax=Phytophthora ramorum TaxID=164328 RepID=UPI0030A4BC5A|nr:hypothetical protein KRP23_276 [Phytophthora ramorum]
MIRREMSPKRGFSAHEGVKLSLPQEWGQNIKRETSSQVAATTEAQGESTPETTERNLEQNSGVRGSQEGRAAETERKDHEKVDAQAGKAKAKGGQGQVFDQGVDVQMSEEPDSELPEHKRESNASSERVEDADMTDMEAEKRAEREIDTPATVETGTKRQQKKSAASKLRGRSPTLRIRPQYKGNLTLQAEDEEHSQEPTMVNILMDVLGSSVDSLGLRKLLMGISTANDNRRGESDFFALSVSGFNTAAKP